MEPARAVLGSAGAAPQSSAGTVTGTAGLAGTAGLPGTAAERGESPRQCRSSSHTDQERALPAQPIRGSGGPRTLQGHACPRGGSPDTGWAPGRGWGCGSSPVRALVLPRGHPTGLTPLGEPFSARRGQGAGFGTIPAVNTSPRAPRRGAGGAPRPVEP